MVHRRGNLEAARTKIARVRDVLTISVEEVPTLDELATAVGMNRFQLSRMFHRIAGVSIREYVRDVRLQRACELLTVSKQSITEIALECGFYDSSHFERTFRPRFRMTPTEFRGSRDQHDPCEKAKKT